MANEKEKVQQELNAFIDANFDRVRKHWNNIPPEEARAHVRSLRHKIRMIDEEERVQTVNGTPYELIPEDIKKLIALISRRKHPELWTTINKKLEDGMLFTFWPIQYEPMEFCNCSDEQLQEQIAQTNLSIEQLTGTKDGTLEHLRQQHSLRLQKIHNTGATCLHPITINHEIFQTKHTIGNWGCKGCLNLGQSIQTTEDANEAVSLGIKSLEWCPKFISVLRDLPITDYIKSFSSDATYRKMCYAGLLHSEMTFDESTECGCTDDQLAIQYQQDEVGAEDIRYLREEHCKQLNGIVDSYTCEHPKTTKYIIITKHCDTCNHCSVERKEYNEPEQIKNNDVLIKI